MPGLDPLRAAWLLLNLAGVSIGLYNLVQAVGDGQAARGDKRRLTAIEAQHAILTEEIRLLIQLTFVGAAVLAVVSPASRRPLIHIEVILFSVLYVVAELLTLALIGLDFWKRRRIDGLAPAEFMRSALAKHALWRDQDVEGGNR